MDIATQYAKALFAIEKPSLPALKDSLERRGRLKLLPRIYGEYRKLLTKRERSMSHATATAESERTRVLLELYRVLVATK